MQQSRLENEPFFILDNGLNPQIAQALSSLQFRIRSVQDEFQNPEGAVTDPDIIRHIAQEYGFRGVWIARDESSKRVHRELIQTQGISVVWIREPTLSAIQQARIVVYLYPRVYQDLTESRRPLYYIVTFHGQPNRERINVIPEREFRRRGRR